MLYEKEFLNALDSINKSKPIIVNDNIVGFAYFFNDHHIISTANNNVILFNWYMTIDSFDSGKFSSLSKKIELMKNFDEFVEHFTPIIKEKFQFTGNVVFDVISFDDYLK